MDFSGVLNGLAGGTAITGMLAAGTLIAALGFAIWAVRLVAQFFDAVDELWPGGETHAEHSYEEACRKCGEYSPNGPYTLCDSCDAMGGRE